MKKYNTEQFEVGLKKLNITISDTQMNQFLTYYDILVEKNKVMNLTAITEFSQVVEKHFLDSLELAAFVSFKEKKSVIDVGTGAGFPGIPLKILFPDIKTVLLDSLNKRVGFLKEVVETLGLKNVETLHGRAEDYGRMDEYRERFDFCVSRAVANLSSLSEYCLPFVRVGGYFVPYKSGSIEEEIKMGRKAVFLLGGTVEKVEQFSLGEAERSLVFVKKEKSTPKKYPRKAGLPTKEPLG